MATPLSLRFYAQTQHDVRRITNELTDIQRQIASGAVANTLQGFGSASGRLLSAQSMVAATDSRASVINQLQARFGVQTAALSQVSDAASTLAQSIRDALSSNDGRGISTELELSFSSIVAALNERWNGQPMFGGERQGAGPIRVTTLEELQAASSPAAIFDEAARHQVIDMGGATPLKVAPKASELAQGLFDTLTQVKDMLDSVGGTLGQPISNANITELRAIADALDGHAATFTNEEGRTGQVQSRLEMEYVRLTERSDLLTKEIGEHADADPAELSIKLNTLLVQYEAAAKTFSELSQLSLLKYL